MRELFELIEKEIDEIKHEIDIEIDKIAMISILYFLKYIKSLEVDNEN